MTKKGSTIDRINIKYRKKEKYHCSTQLQSGSMHSAPADVGEENFITWYKIISWYFCNNVIFQMTLSTLTTNALGCNKIAERHLTSYDQSIKASINNV